jgi:hypothetical protein
MLVSAILAGSPTEPEKNRPPEKCDPLHTFRRRMVPMLP